MFHRRNKMVRVFAVFCGVNLLHLLLVGKGLGMTGGPFQGNPGYKSYLAIDNPNYTHGYIADTVPYLLVGIKSI